MAYQDRTVRILKAGEHFAAGHQLVVRQEYDDQTTTVMIRRVIPSGGKEELQIEIEIVKRGEKRSTIAHGSILCSPEIADAIGNACLTVQPPKERVA